MRIALAQLNPVVGDIVGNTEKIIATIRGARERGASLAAFPELAVVGYPPRDLLLKPRFVAASVKAVEKIAAACTEIAAIVGFVEPNVEPLGRHLRNAAAYCADGRVRQVRHKSLLPTYDVFDERRYFEPGPEVALIDHAGVSIGLSICEDLWNEQEHAGRRFYSEDPVGRLASAGAKVLLNISASPFGLGKHAEMRIPLFGQKCRKYGLPLLFVNQVGGNDELIFDGASAALDEKGNVFAQARAFDEDLLVVDLKGGSAVRTEEPASVRDASAQRALGEYPQGMAELFEALVLGTRDYVRKCDFKRVVLGLSGGIDSAVVAAIAAAAVGPEGVVGVSMPSRYSSEHSKSDAAAVARNLGIEYKTIPIAPVHDAFETQLAEYAGEPLCDVAAQNLQARIRGATLMGLSNHFGWLLLTTGNKSELAVGYSTLYGDMCGGLAVISDVPKTLVYPLARYINERAGREIVPQGSLTKPPSAELRPDQADQDTLPPYELLDAIVERYVNQEQSADEIIAAGFDPAVVTKVIRWIDLNEYKRKQMPPGLKVTSRAFGVGRRMPIAARFRY